MSAVNIDTEPRRIYRTAAVGIAGPPLVGKTELLGEFARLTNIRPHDVDDARWKIFSRIPEEYKDGRRSMQMIAAYAFMHAEASQDLANGAPAATTATYSYRDYVQGQRDLARLMKVPGLILVLNASEEVLPERIARRAAQGGASTVTTLEFARENWARFTTPEGDDVHKIYAGGTIEETVHQAFAVMERLRIV